MVLLGNPTNCIKMNSVQSFSENKREGNTNSFHETNSFRTKRHKGKRLILNPDKSSTKLDKFKISLVATDAKNDKDQS